jgi:dTDP-glucose 4,6-dehydratase
MHKGISKLLVTGGAGFIGSAFVRLAANRGYKIAVVDKLTYAGDLKRLGSVRNKFNFYKTDICDFKKLDSIFLKERPDKVVHFAAESHVDRSIKSAKAFMETNINGTYNLAELVRKHNIKRFLHLSTDEVYGEIDKGKFKEDSPIKPNSPYSATKAAADLLISSYVRTYGLPAIIVRPCNNYGPWQYPEKLIPLALLRLMQSKKVPVYGKGLNVREWLYVDDCARGVLAILEKGNPGDVYNLGSGQERRNIDLVRSLLKFAGKPKNGFEYVTDRPGHDTRYSLNSSKVINGIGWRPSVKFDNGIKMTVAWCYMNREWLLKKSAGNAKYY